MATPQAFARAIGFYAVIAAVPLAVLTASAAAQSVDDIQRALDRPLLDANQPLVEAQVYTASRVPLMPTPATAQEWDAYAARLRKRVLDEAVFRGQAREWRKADRKIEWMDTIAATGYRVKKFRFEIVPGFWAPGLLYEPEKLSGKVPVVMNVNGHEQAGIATPYIQQRCINLAKRGMLAVNAEWIGRGQLDVSANVHYRLAQIDLTGTSGLAVFYLQLERTLDLILAHPNADPSRVAVTGLSGGGWQTTIISSLDTRVKLSVPAAGHSSYVTRAQWPELDLGDSEQTPSDLASIADYTHLTAMIAPRPLMLINNAKDNCCFRADYAMGPLLQTSRAIFALHGAADKLRYFINHSQGHNYDETSREELYRFLRDQFYPRDSRFPLAEIPSEGEVRQANQLATPLPPGNATLHSLAMDLARGLPRPGNATRERLAKVVRASSLPMDAREVKRESVNGNQMIWWRLRLGGAWTVPAVEIGAADAKETVIVFGDAGRRTLAKQISAALGKGKRVLAVDPFSFGESRLAKRDFLFGILLAGLGERPLGVEANQITAIARWLKGRGQQVSLEAYGTRLSLVALVAAALDRDSISGVRTNGSVRHLREILEQDMTVEKAPELFCFGLLESFEIESIAQLAMKADIQ